MIHDAHRRAALPLYAPSLLLGIPAQASLVLLPLFVLELGGTPAAAAAVVGWRGLGMMAMDLPAGMLAARHGERGVMIAASAVVAGALFAYATSPGLAWFYAIAFVSGAGGSSFLLGRMAYISVVHAGLERGRVIAMIAGGMRASALIGPLGGTAIAHVAGYPAAFVTGGVMMLCGLVCIVVFAGHAPRQDDVPRWRGYPHLLLEFRGVFATAGTAAVTFMLLRAARTVLLPLTGAAIGLDAPTIGFVVFVSALVDVAMFYPAGVMMDRRGRRATAVPSSILFALALAGLALVDGFHGLMLVAIAAGFANGLSTGIVMTLGTDLAPPARRGEFLGLWRLLTDLGTAAGPMVVSSVVAVAPLTLAALAIGVLGAGGSFVVYRYVEETLPDANGPDARGT